MLDALVVTGGNDTLTGGSGNNVMIGDNSIFIAPQLTINVIENGMHDIRDLRDYNLLLGTPIGHIYVTDGNDRLLGGSASDLMVGDDVLSISMVAKAVTINGRLAHDYDYDTALVFESPQVCMIAGRDIINGRGGNDVIIGDELVVLGFNGDYDQEGARIEQHDKADNDGENVHVDDDNLLYGRHHDDDDGEIDIVNNYDTIYGGDGRDVIWGGSLAGFYACASDEPLSEAESDGALVFDDNSGAFFQFSNLKPFENFPGNKSDYVFGDGQHDLLFGGNPSAPLWQTAIDGEQIDNVALLTNDQLLPIIAEAKQLWIDALGTGDGRLAVLDTVEVSTGNLPEGRIGATVGNEIVIDSSAAGRGWFVDSSPGDNSEFVPSGIAGEMAAVAGSAAFGRMDLLSTVMHEMGNAMGFKEDKGHDVMSDTLTPGTRYLLTPAANGNADAMLTQVAAESFARFALLEEHWMPDFGVGSAGNHEPGLSKLLEEFDWSGLDNALSGGNRGSIDWGGRYFGNLWSPFGASGGKGTSGIANIPDFLHSLFESSASGKDNGVATSTADEAQTYDQTGADLLKGFAKGGHIGEGKDGKSGIGQASRYS